MSVVKFAPILIGFGILVLVTGYTEFLEPYWLDLSSKSTISMLFLAPGFAALAAWDAARWRTLMPNSTRSWLTILSLELAVVAAASAITFSISLLILFASNPPSTGFPRFDVLGMAIWVTVGYTGIGFLMGRFLPRTIAAPTAFAVIWLWAAYTPAIQPFWLRNVTGNLGASCCSISDALDPAGLIAPSTLATALILTSIALLLWGNRWLTWLGSAAIITAAVALGAHLVSPLGADPVRARTGSQICHAEDTTTFCGWPEHEPNLTRALSDLTAVVQKLRTMGFAIPTQLNEGKTLPGGWTLTLGSEDPKYTTEAFVASPMNYAYLNCAQTSSRSVGENELVADAWLRITAGVPVSQAVDSAGADPRKLEKLLSYSTETQVEWYKRNMTAIQRCEPNP